MVAVYTSAEFDVWYKELNGDAQEDVATAVGKLMNRGVALTYPSCSAIMDTKYPLRELRVQSKGRPLRVIYAFDPDRDAYLIIGGYKTDEKNVFINVSFRRQRRYGKNISRIGRIGRIGRLR